MGLTDRLSSLLSFPAGFRLFARAVRGDAWPAYLSEYVKPEAGQRVLDLGCGTADVLEHLPRVDYTGLDVSPEYIEAAKQRYGDRGRFLCGDVGLVTLEKEHGTYDLVLATGVVHHLDDAQAARLFELARAALRPQRRLVTLDGCYAPGQSKIARWLLQRDRGKFVRTRAEYERLAAASFSSVQADLRHDLLRIPYTHLIMRCSN